jgi:D-3-phosphoglycerate dehydrogenase
MVRQGDINELVIGASPKLKVIAKHGVGVDNVDLEAAAKRDIPVLLALGSNKLAVAEHTISLTLALIKELVTLDAAVKGGAWPKPTFKGRDIAGSRIGLIGYGAIGHETARLAQALGMIVKVYDPHSAQAAQSGFDVFETVEALVANVDIISLHCPLTSETRHLINAKMIDLMPPHMLIVNTARGGVIDEAALATALRERKIAGAALDSFGVEPPGADHPLWKVPNLIVSPHVAGTTPGASMAMAEIAARHIICVLDGNAPDQRSLANVSALALRRAAPVQ